MITFAILMEFYLNAVLFLLTLIGGTLPLWWRSWTDRHSKLLITFSGAFLFTICFSHLIPDSMTHQDTLTVSMLILVGFFAQFFIQKFTHGIEHGHNCAHHHSNTLSWSLLIGLGIHSFVEGLPLSTGFFSLDALIPLYFAIAIHKIPSAIIVTSMFFHSERDRSKTFLITAIFSLIVPIAAFIGMAMNHYVESFHELIHYLVPLITGSFLQISTAIFYESSTQTHDMKGRKWIVVFLGIILGSISAFIHY